MQKPSPSHPPTHIEPPPFLLNASLSIIPRPSITRMKRRGGNLLVLNPPLLHMELVLQDDGEFDCG